MVEPFIRSVANMFESLNHECVEQKNYVFLSVLIGMACKLRAHKNSEQRKIVEVRIGRYRSRKTELLSLPFDPSFTYHERARDEDCCLLEKLRHVAQNRKQ